MALDNPKLYWIGFNMVKGIGAVRFKALVEAFGSPEQAWHAPSELLRNTGLSAKIVENLIQVRSQVSLDQIWERLQTLGIQVLTWEDEAYPRLLLEIDQPPPVLYVHGQLMPQDAWCVAIVGTRHFTSYGRQVAEQLASGLAQNGITVVSGLARGIDAIAHQSSLRAGGRTLAVLGSGIDRISPPEHRRLAQEISARGAVISDYPLGTEPDASNFPPHNRIISGLAQAVIVVEAGGSSGALITANFAAEQGREVFAVPGSIVAPQSKGCNRLIQQGAQPMLDLQDVLETLNMTMVLEQRTARINLPTDEVEKKLYQALTQEPQHVDLLREQTDLPFEKVTAALTMMELKGMVRQVGMMQYIALRETPEEYQV